jgi:hypothetical protein
MSDLVTVGFALAMATVVCTFSWAYAQVRWAESDADRERSDARFWHSMVIGLRRDLTAEREAREAEYDAKALLRRQSRARLREARRWRDRAKAAGWTRGSA